MRVLFIVLAISLSAVKAFARYDDTWFKSKFWSGEYPIGFSVTKRHTVVMGRADMDKDLPRDVVCEMPYLAVIHPWNKERIKKSHIQFFSATKILKFVAKDDFEFYNIHIKKGDVIEYIGNGAEDYFGVRVAGKPYTAYQDLFDHVEAPDQDQFIEDDWVLLTCQGSNNAYIFFPDIAVQGPKGTDGLVPGISDTGPGQDEGFGRARDLTEQEASAIEKEKAAAKK
jgi:hypothetical protein